MNDTLLTPLPQVLLKSDFILLRGCSYGRVSTRGQMSKKIKIGNRKILFDKASPEEQKKITKTAIGNYRGFCPKCNIELKIIFTEPYFDEGISGRTGEREDIERLMQDAIEGKFQVVFVPYSSRLGRNVTISANIREKLKKVGIQVYSLAQPVQIRCPACFDPLDDDSAVITETISDLQSQLELSQIRRNYKIGMPKRIRDGKPAGSLAYGLFKTYKIIGKNERGDEIVKVKYKWNDKLVRIVHRIANEYMQGEGTWQISKKLNIEDIPSSKGKTWGRSSILCILKNPTYAGRVRWGWKPVRKGKRVIQPKDKWLLEKSEFKGIWNLAYYEKLQEEIARRATVGGRAAGSDGLLIGLLKCGYCKYSMFQIKSNKIFKNGTRYRFLGYGCGTFLHRGICKHNGIKQEVVDKRTLSEIVKLFDDKTRKVFYENIINAKYLEMEKLLKEKKAALIKTQQEYQRTIDAYQKGIDTIEEYAVNKDKYFPIIARYTQDIQILERKSSHEGTFDWDIAYEETIKRFLNTPTLEDKKKVKSILTKIIDRIEFRRNPRSIYIKYKIFPSSAANSDTIS